MGSLVCTLVIAGSTVIPTKRDEYGGSPISVVYLRGASIKGRAVRPDN